MRNKNLLLSLAGMAASALLMSNTVSASEIIHDAEFYVLKALRTPAV